MVLTRRNLLAVLAAIACLFGVAMLHPYPRQLLFGPTIRDEPWCVWEERVRRFVHSEEYNKSLIGRVETWLGWNTGCTFKDLYHPGMAPLYAELLQDRDTNVRRMVLGFVEWSENLHQEILLPPLWQTLANDANSTNRMLAARAIWKIGKDQSLATALFLELENRQSEVRGTAMQLLVPICAADPALLDRVQPFTKDDDTNVRSQAMFAVGASGKSGLPTLIRGLYDHESLVVWAAASAIRSLEAEARPAVPALGCVALTRQFPSEGCGTHPMVPIMDTLRLVDPDVDIMVRVFRGFEHSDRIRTCEKWLNSENVHLRGIAAEVLSTQQKR